MSDRGVHGVLLDLGGVVYVGDEALPGAIEAVQRLKRAGLPVRYITNTTRRPVSALVEKTARMGLEIAPDELLAPARIARTWLQERGLKPHLLVHPDLEADFAGLDGGQGEAVVIGDAGEAFTYAALNAAYRKLEAGADFLALAANRNFKDSDGELSLDAGPFVRALEYASGREAVVVGKPSAAFFQAALDELGCGPAEAVMVGDDADADVLGALEAGLRAVLVRTGKYPPARRTRWRVRRATWPTIWPPRRTGFSPEVRRGLTLAIARELCSHRHRSAARGRRQHERQEESRWARPFHSYRRTVTCCPRIRPRRRGRRRPGW